MCGICGVWEYQANEGRVDSSLVARMRDQMVHRGPDDSGEREEVAEQIVAARGEHGLRVELHPVDRELAVAQPHGCRPRWWR